MPKNFQGNGVYRKSNKATQESQLKGKSRSIMYCESTAIWKSDEKNRIFNNYVLQTSFWGYCRKDKLANTARWMGTQTAPDIHNARN